MAYTGTRIDISGIENINRKAEGLKRDIFSILGEAAKAGADIVKEAAKAKARKKSGALARGVVSAVTWDKNAPVAFAGAGMDRNMNEVFAKIGANGKRYYYPASIEYGHGGVPAYPFMRPAMDENKAKVRNEIKARVKAALEGAGR